MKDLKACLVIICAISITVMLFNPAMIAFFFIKGVGLAVIMMVVNLICRIISGKSFLDLYREMREEQRKEGP